MSSPKWLDWGRGLWRNWCLLDLIVVVFSTGHDLLPTLSSQCMLGVLFVFLEFPLVSFFRFLRLCFSSLKFRCCSLFWILKHVQRSVVVFVLVTALLGSSVFFFLFLFLIFLFVCCPSLSYHDIDLSLSCIVVSVSFTLSLLFFTLSLVFLFFDILLQLWTFAISITGSWYLCTVPTSTW